MLCPNSNSPNFMFVKVDNFILSPFPTKIFVYIKMFNQCDL